MLIFGLGNPGIEFARTRHNLGLMTVNFLAKSNNFPRWKKLNLSKVTRGIISWMDVILAKPLVYMNLNGEALLSLMNYYRISPEGLLVILDDIALPFGKIRFRPSGSDGGHRGLSSVIKKIGRNDFPRLRIGINSPPEGIDAADYVLSPFLPEEKEQLPWILETCAVGIQTLIEDGIDSAMNRFN